MAYLRWSDSDWYIYWSSRSKDNELENQCLALWYIKSERQPLVSYSEIGDLNFEQFCNFVKKLYEGEELSELEDAYKAYRKWIGEIKKFCKNSIREVWDEDFEKQSEEIPKIIVSIRNFKTREWFEIREFEEKYSLFFLEWNYSGKPWDYVDPIVVDSTYEECVEKLKELLLNKSDFRI